MKRENSSFKNKGKGTSDKPFAKKSRQNSSSDSDRLSSYSRKSRKDFKSENERSFSSPGKSRGDSRPTEERSFSSDRKPRTNPTSNSERSFSTSGKSRTGPRTDGERKFKPKEDYPKKRNNNDFSPSDGVRKSYSLKQRESDENSRGNSPGLFSKSRMKEVSATSRGLKKEYTKFENTKPSYSDRFKKQFTKKEDDFDSADYKSNSEPRKSVYSKKKQLEYNKKNFDINAPVRLNKFIANTGLCSRREADEYIKAGLVSVNGKVITELGVKVNPADEIKYNGERLKTEKKVYLILNKPKDFVTTVDDPHAEKTVMQLVAGACRERIYPVGRLDRNTTGVLLFTNDGDLTKQLTHPKHNKKKVYHVHLDQPITKIDLDKLTQGIELEDGLAQADEASFVDEGDKKQLGVEIHSGKNRVIRRMFESLGYKVVKLDRVYFAGLSKKGLTRGKWRFLTEQEISMLKKGSYQ